MSSLIVPAGPVNLASISGEVTRFDTGSETLGVLPAGAVPLFTMIAFTQGSNAPGGASVDVGTAAEPRCFIGGHPVHVGREFGYLIDRGLRLGQSVGVDTPVVATYRENGPSTDGGPFGVSVVYAIP